MFKLLGQLILLTLGMQIYTVDGADNCGWIRRKDLIRDGESFSVEISDNNYANNVTCSIEIVYPPSQRARHMKVEVSSFELKGSSATGHICLVESERLTLQMETNSGLQSVTWCGQLYSERHVFPTSKLTLIYNSGLIGQGKGFKLKVSLVLVGTDSGFDFKASEQPKLLYSPNFPDEHDHNIKGYYTSLVGENNHYILIRILMIDLEPNGMGGCHDSLTINSDVYCGKTSQAEDVIVENNRAEIKFKSDYSDRRRGFILEYAAYAFKDLSDRGSAPEPLPEGVVGPALLATTDVNHEEIDQVPKLFYLSGSRIAWHFTAKNDSHTLHIERVGSDYIFDTFFSESGFGRHEIMSSLKHYWSKTSSVSIVKAVTGPGHMFILVRSVAAGHDVGLFRADHTIAWLQRKYNGLEKRDLKVYLSEGSIYNIGVKISNESTMDGLTIRNGPTAEYFDMVKGCNPKLKNQKEFISWNTKIVAIGLSSDQWQRGLQIEYFPTVQSPPRTKVETGSYSVIDSGSDQKLRNLFCFLEVLGDRLLNTELTAKTNLNVPDSVVLRQKSTRLYDNFGTVEVAKLAELKKQEVELQFRWPVAVEVNITIPDDSKVLDQDPEVSLDVALGSKYLMYNTKNLYASPDHVEEVSAPSFLILASPPIDSIWNIRPVEETGFIKITMFTLPNAPVDSNSCANFEVVSKTQNGTYYSVNFCSDGFGNPPKEDLYLRGPGTITLRRPAWMELPDPLFTYTMVSDLEGPTQLPPFFEHVCPPEVTIGDGVDFIFSSLNFQPYVSHDNTIHCEMKILPKYYDSVIRANILNFYQINWDFAITIIGYDPSDPDELPIKELDVKRAIGVTTFRHMALKITATVPRSGYHFNIRFTFEQMATCNENEFPFATEDFQYIVSPNYPHPFPRGLYCEWRFSQMGPIYFELVEYEGSGICADDSLDVIFGDHSDTRQVRYCGMVDEKREVEDEEGSYLWQTVRVRFRSRTNSGDYKGFMLRYKLKEASDQGYVGDNDHRSSSGNKTGVAVGSSIASILFLLILGAAVAVFVTHRRRERHQQRMRNRRDLVRNWRQQRSGSSSSVTPSVFVVGSMVVNTNAPPPPYPGLPENSRDSTDYANTSGGYYTNPDGGYTNSAGQFTAQRGNGAQDTRNNTAAGTPTEYSELDLPPPYHPLMPGSPYSSEDHVYHPLASPRDSGIAMSNTTLYSMAQSTSSINRSGHEEENTTSPQPQSEYCLPSPVEEEEGRGEDNDPAGDIDNGLAEPGHHSNHTSSDHEEPRYAVPSSLQVETEAPPSYEDSNPPHPPHPPPSNELATYSNASGSENPTVRLQGRAGQARNGRLGSL